MEQSAPSTTSQPSLVMQKSDVYDVVNSYMVLTVYFKYAWKDRYKNSNNRIPYYLKFIKDNGYDGYNTEFPRAFERLNEIMDSENPFKTAILYQNHNKAKMVKNVENPEVFKIVDKKGTLELTTASDLADNVSEFIIENFKQLLEKYHGKI